MATMKNPLTHASPLPSLTPVRTSTPLKSSLSTLQPILPDIVSSTVLQKDRTKKRVRFALKLEVVEESRLSSPNPDKSVVSTTTPTTKPIKRVIDPWREDGPLYGAYVEYLQTKDNLTPEISETNQSSPSELEVESSTYTHTFVIQSKSPEVVIDSITVSTPSRHLPRLVHQAKTTKKTNNRKQPSPSVVDSFLKPGVNVSAAPRHIQSRKIPVNNKNRLNSTYPIVKRADLTLPSIKTLNSNEKILRTEYPIETKLVNEYLPSKKLTEIITNPLPGTNNQINSISDNSILLNLPKTSEISCQDQINTESYFFQNHNNDHIQPIIH